MEKQTDRYGPETEPQAPAPGIFGRVNNYLLLFYSLACFLMYYSVSGLLILQGWLILSLSLPGIVAFIMPLFVLSRRFSLKFTEEYTLNVPDKATAALALLISFSAILPVDTLSGLLERKWPPDVDYISFLLSIKPKGLLAFIAVAVGTVVIAPLSEELIFRGFIQRIFQRNMRGVLAVVLAGLIFGVCHFVPSVIPGVAFLGILLGYLFLRTGNLIYPVIAHGGYNLVSLLRLHLTPEDAIKAGEVPAPPIMWTLASILALIAGIILIERRHSKHGTEA
ncbi:MAG: CPBP family intramembrane metalloprotease [Candidatus Krumholzibacteria bacterium]|nr:CPBP family intramembrane metalloprotease [Candidatus Krumholzibacteria bacterium]